MKIVLNRAATGTLGFEIVDDSADDTLNDIKHEKDYASSLFCIQMVCDSGIERQTYLVVIQRGPSEFMVGEKA
jgi:hypothetical protein